MVLIIVALVDKAPPAVLLPAGGGLFGAIAPTSWTGRSAHSAITATAQRWVSPLLGHTLRAPKAFYAASRRHSPLDLRGHQSRPPVGIRLSTSVVTNLVSLSLLLDAGIHVLCIHMSSMPHALSMHAMRLHSSRTEHEYDVHGSRTEYACVVHGPPTEHAHDTYGSRTAYAHVKHGSRAEHAYDVHG
jgi:hypothetical protein